MLTLAILVLASLVACASVVAVRIRNASQNALYDVVVDDDSTEAPDFLSSMDSKILAKTGNIKAIPFNPSVHLDVAVPHTAIHDRKTDLQTVSAPRQIVIGKSDEKATVMISREIVLDDVAWGEAQYNRMMDLAGAQRGADGKFRVRNFQENEEYQALIAKKVAYEMAKKAQKVR